MCCTSLWLILTDNATVGPWPGLRRVFFQLLFSITNRVYNQRVVWRIVSTELITIRTFQESVKCEKCMKFCINFSSVKFWMQRVVYLKFSVLKRLKPFCRERKPKTCIFATRRCGNQISEINDYELVMFRLVW